MAKSKPTGTQEKAEFTFEDVEHQKNPAIPANAKRAIGQALRAEAFVWSFAAGEGFQAVRSNFVNHQESVTGVGDTPDEAISSLLDAELNAALSDRPEKAQDSSDEENEQSGGTNGGPDLNTTEVITEPSMDSYLNCDADHKNCDRKDDCKEHHKKEAEHRIAQQS